MFKNPYFLHDGENLVDEHIIEEHFDLTSTSMWSFRVIVEGHRRELYGFIEEKHYGVVLAIGEDESETWVLGHWDRFGQWSKPHMTVVQSNIRTINQLIGSAHIFPQLREFPHRAWLGDDLGLTERDNLAPYVEELDSVEANVVLITPSREYVDGEFHALREEDGLVVLLVTVPSVRVPVQGWNNTSGREIVVG